MKSNNKNEGHFNIYLFVLLIIALPLTAFKVYSWYQNKYEQLPVFKTKNNTIEGFKLFNQDSVEIDVSKFENKILVANFFFTRCPIVCPKMMNNLNLVQQEFVNDNHLNIISFTVDPENDRPTQLKKYIKRMGFKDTKWSLITGLKKDIYKIARNNFNVVATDGDGGPEDFIHSDRLVLIDSKKNIRGYYDGVNSNEITQLIKDIKKLKNENK